MTQYLFNERIQEEWRFYQRQDLMAKLCGKVPEWLTDYRLGTFQALDRPVWAKVRELFRRVVSPDTGGLMTREGVLQCGSPHSAATAQQEMLSALVKELLPWRKGPWNISGSAIDSEWRSDMKFDVLREALGDVRGRTILDIGSGNGYYALRLAEFGAEAVLCLDPSERFFLQLELAQKFAQEPRVQLELLGFRDVPRIGYRFDCVLCMGVLYHQKDPLSLIEICRDTLTSGGVLALESMSYPSTESIAFFPPGRYAKAHNVYFLPSACAMVSMLERAGFQDVRIAHERVTTVEEQRRTELAPYESLADFLNPRDPSRTIEGHPAPQRALVIGVRG
jgi:tRNA (mo5U34)-methyltransferase